MAKKKDEFFVNIPDSSVLRRNILESSQQIVEAMKSYEKYKQIKLEKLRKIEQLKNILNTMRENAAKLRGFLPTVKSIPQQKQKQERIPNVTLLELEQLNAEIKKLEDELNIK